MKTEFTRFEKMSSWWSHLFWCLGKMYLCAIRGYFDCAKEMYFWLKIHLLHKSKLISRGKTPFLEKLVVLFGLLATAWLLLLLTLIIYFILT